MDSDGGCDTRCYDAWIAGTFVNNIGAVADVATDGINTQVALSNGPTTVFCGNSTGRGARVDNGPLGLGLFPGVDCDGDGRIDVRVGPGGGVRWR